MAKRFTDTEKWDDPFFYDLPAWGKLLWIYVCDKCSHAGIWKQNKSQAEATTGIEIDWSEIESKFSGKIFEKNGYWFIPSFLTFQYGRDLSGGKSIDSAIKQINDFGFTEIAIEKVISYKSKLKINSINNTSIPRTTVFRG